MHHLLNRLAEMDSPRVLLVGDFMLDRYVYGDVERISPEAPVPVLKVVRREARAGGAGNVALSIPALGGAVECLGAIGEDADGEQMLGLLNEAGAAGGDMIRLGRRCTTVKSRFVGLAQHRRAQQMFRVDEEQAEPLEAEVLDRIEAAIEARLPACDILALEDYNKGVLSHERTAKWIAKAREAGKAVVVDPALIEDYGRYRGATLLTPNRYETARASGMAVESGEQVAAAAARLLDEAQAEAVAVTLDKEGMLLARRGGAREVVPTRPRAVYDVSGAGDVVLAMFALALGGGCRLREACELANVAGGLEVERFGVVPISREEVIDEIEREIGLRRSKVLDRHRLAAEVDRRKRRGESVVFTNGCFDLLHMGHVRYLQQARELGNCLIVATNSDASVARLKGPSRPIIGQSERAEMLSSLECVDFVTIFDEDTPEALLEALQPDVLVKGGTTPVVVGREIVEGYGGKVLTLEAVEGLSTTQIIDRIAGADQASPAQGYKDGEDA
jgi:D-beta-D-heptose 7-phosphate kinase/D-beta-D-heptose 1-phosphate adenosyltransferase